MAENVLCAHIRLQKQLGHVLRPEKRVHGEVSGGPFDIVRTMLDSR